MILVTGAAGKTGRAVCRALTEQQQPVRAFVRRGTQREGMQELGVQEVVVGDLLDSAAVRQAVAGATAVYHICPNMSQAEMTIGQIILEAVQAQSDTHFVYHSVLHPQVEAMPHHWLKMRVEELLLAAQTPFTILQPAAYMQNILAQQQQIRGEGLYIVPYAPETRLSLVDLADVAAVAALVLTEPEQHQGAVYELVGQRPLSQQEIAAALGEHLQRPVVAQLLPRHRWAAQAEQDGLGDYQVTSLLKMFRYYEQYHFAGNENVLAWLLGRQPTSFKAWLARAWA